MRSRWAALFLTLLGLLFCSAPAVGSHRPCHKVPCSSPGDTTAPTAPTLSGTSGDKQVSLSWTAATDNVGVASYEVWRDAVWVATLSSSARSYTVTGLTNGETHNFRVVAYDAARNYTNSNTVTIGAAAPTPPPPPPPPPTGGCTVNVTPSTFTSEFNAAAPGAVICLASGTYGAFTGGTKAGLVTVRPAEGATPSMSIQFGPSASNIRVDGFTNLGGWDLNGSQNIQIVNSKFTSPMQVRGATSGIVFDNDTFYGLGHGTWEGRLSFAQGAKDAIVRNSEFGGGGCSDGIQLTGGTTNVTIEYNTFSGLRQGACSAHVDPIQFYGAHGTKILSNYFHNNSTGIMSPDGNGSPMTVRNNVFVMDEYHGALIGGGTTDSEITHNVVVGVGRAVHLIVDTANSGTRSSNTVVRDNVSSVIAEGDNLTVTNNLLPSSVTFRGGDGRCAYALADGSNGKGAGLNGTDIGLTDCGTTVSPTRTQDGRTLVFEDNFDGTAVNTANWRMYNSAGHAGNGLRRPSAFSVVNGQVVVTATWDGTNIVTGGMAHNKDYLYGTFEVRVRTEADPSAQTSGVVLTWPQSENWPYGGENDWYETGHNNGATRTPFYSYIHHHKATWGGDQTQIVHNANGQDWHIMRMDWSPTHIKVYRDGAYIGQVTNVDDIPNEPHHMTIQLDAFKNGPLPHPIRMYVDWIRVYK